MQNRPRVQAFWACAVGLTRAAVSNLSGFLAQRDL